MSLLSRSLVFGLCLSCGVGFVAADEVAEDRAPLLAMRPAPKFEPVAAPRPLGDTTGADYIDLVIYLRERPVIVRVHITHDVRNYRHIWDGYVDRLLAEHDVNEDGSLGEDEIAGLPGVEKNQPTTVVRNRGGLFSFLNPANRPTQKRVSHFDAIDREPRDGAISRDELITHLIKKDLGPLRSVIVTGNAATSIYTPANMRKVFDLFDADGDGFLVEDELKSVGERVKLFDRNDDETISMTEVLGNPYRGVIGGGTSTNEVRSPERVVNRFGLIVNGNVPDRLIEEFKTRYGKGLIEDWQGVPTSLLSWDGPRHASVDANEDGHLNTPEEIADYLRQPGLDYEFAVDVGNGLRGEPRSAKNRRARFVPVKLLNPSVDALVPDRCYRSEDGSYILNLGDVQFEIGAGGSRNQYSVGNFFIDRFNDSDRDNNAYIDRDEARQSYYFQEDFDEIDRDGNDMIYEDEVSWYVESKADRARSRTQLSIVDARRSLFDALDRDRDFRLKAYELDGGVVRSRGWDSDHDGKISPEEVPQQIRLIFGKGVPEFRGFSFSSGTERNVRTTRRNVGPKWFQTMDRNKDGDVSRREFLGNLELFDRIDTNDDGLITFQEAEATATETAEN